MVSARAASILLALLVGGWLAERLGSATLFHLVAALALPALLLSLVFGFAYGYYQAVYSAIAMALSDPRIAALMFAVLMMFLNIGVAAGQGLGGLITEALGFGGPAVLMSALGLSNLLLVQHLHMSRPASKAGR